MNNVNLKKTELLVILERNRSKHNDEFEEAFEGYRLVVIENLEKALSMAENYGKIITRFNIEKPRNHLEQYDTIIKIIKLTNEEEIEITQEEFKCYVMDQWQWSTSFYELVDYYKQ